MIGQLSIFTTSGREPLAAPDAVTPAEEDTALCPTEPASRPEPSTDDGSLHWMLTGQPEPKKAAA